jgi:DtxR family Mn-dependent transcriptional regulator
MLPSYTVENYLKAIFQAQIGRGKGELVPMGQLAAALGVVPGTATTMMKALAESGLVKYEPYAGVRLTAAGEKLAAMVLRRHRLIELFLVKVMGMSWTEVHDEAEQLEHAVSDRLIDRIDEMLGRPAVDPHGDPIPDSRGAFDRRRHDTLLTCPLHERVTVSRVTDQDSTFLHFVERHDLKPGSIVEVEDRDEAADSVRLRGEGNKRFTIGARAASKVLVEALQILFLCLLTPLTVDAQTSQPSQAQKSAAFAILDNSFLVEEAFNQEAGIFQNIFGFQRIADAWEFAFTQEWPVGSQKHQFSYTLPFLDHSARSAGIGNLMLNYRYQATLEGPGRPALSPRFSLILPTDNGGDDWRGFQVNLPASKQRGDFFFHGNAGFTYLHRTSEATNAGVSLRTPYLSGSAIYRLRPMFNLMYENILSFSEVEVDPGRTGRQTVFTTAPGARGGWNLGDHQLIIGASAPISFGEQTDAGIFLYLSYELPFKK